MKFKFAFVATIAAIAAFSFTGCSNAPKPVAGLPQVSDPALLPQEFCYFEGEPSSDVSFVPVKKMKVMKGTYGSLSQVLPKVQPYAETLGGNAIANFRIAQRFSIWPWRFVTPTAWGRAILITNANGKSCEEMGGHLEEYYANR